MAIMCSLAVCKAQAGMCGHEKVMLSVVHARGYRPWGLLPDQLTGDCGLRGAWSRRMLKMASQLGRRELGD